MNLTQDQYDTLEAWYLGQKGPANTSTKGTSPSPMPKRKKSKPAKRTVITEDSTDDNEKTRSPITAKRKRPTNTRPTASSKTTSVLTTGKPTSSKRRTLAGGSKAIVPTRSPTQENNNVIPSQPTHALPPDSYNSFKRRTHVGQSNRTDSLTPQGTRGDNYDEDATPNNDVENVALAPEDNHLETEHVYEDDDVDEVDKLLLNQSTAEIEEDGHSEHSSDEELVYPPTCSPPKKRKLNAFSRSRSHSPAILNYSFRDSHIVPETEDEAPSSNPESESTPAVSSANLHDYHVTASSPTAAVSIQQLHNANVPLHLSRPSSVGAPGETVFRIRGPPGSRIHIIVDTPTSSNPGPAVHSSPTPTALLGPIRVVNTLRDIQHTLEDLSTNFRFSRRPLQQCIDQFNNSID
ncbi:hypothetical protein VNI00_018990 [Paramarasmius palmivorus]|uniref:Uncharacterized protein n=1 Tax=Paramarasmius palmivorus TaxID=297713 RepID=A0AAW0ATI8_9AGAR